MNTEWEEIDGERYPVYSEDQLKRIAKAAWDARHMMPHPDDVASEWAFCIREFNRALDDLPSFEKENASQPRQDKKR